MNYSYDEKLQELEQILKANLNNSIAEINTKKTDLVLNTVNENNYFYDLVESVNQNTFVYIETDSIESRSSGNKSADIIHINIFLLFVGNGKKAKDNTFIAYRYESAIRDALEKSNDPTFKYEGSVVGGITVQNRALYGAMCSYSVSII